MTDKDKKPTTETTTEENVSTGLDESANNPDSDLIPLYS